MTDKQEPTTAEKLRNEALEIFDGPETAQDVRDVIEWFYGSMLAAPPAQPATDERVRVLRESLETIANIAARPGVILLALAALEDTK